jgi:fatty acid synthase, animal type
LIERIYSDICPQVVDQNTPWNGGLVAINSFGFGGANAHVILDVEPCAGPLRAEYALPRLVLAAGRSVEAVEQMLQLARDNPTDAGLHALMDAVHARAQPGHTHRGYALLADEPVQEVMVGVRRACLPRTPFRRR